MKKKTSTKSTTVGTVDAEVLQFTAGEDLVLDLSLVEWDCIGSAAHAIMLSEMPVKPPVLRRAELARIKAALGVIIKKARAGAFRITLQDQDVHLAVERELTAALGDAGKKIHTGRSRNDQVAVDLRLYAKDQLLDTIGEAAALAAALLARARQWAAVPMVGRTHLQPAMPSSVGLWASAYAESLLEDIATLMHAYDLNDQCPLGSAAGYGVPLPIDRQRVSDLLGFSRPLHNVLHASNARGKNESQTLHALAQVMQSLSRLAQDLVLFTMPEFGYFRLPAALCTGSSIMPQKRNPDVLELVRARAARVLADFLCAFDLVKGAPGGYQRDLQEAKRPLLDGFAVTRSSLRLMQAHVVGLEVDEAALRAGFRPEVFATDRALELVAGGLPFRDAYRQVKAHLDDLGVLDADEALARKRHLGGPAGLDWSAYQGRVGSAEAFVGEERRQFQAAIGRLLDLPGR